MEEEELNKQATLPKKSQACSCSIPELNLTTVPRKCNHWQKKQAFTVGRKQ